MDLKALFPDTNDTKAVVVSLAAAGAAYFLAQKYLGKGKAPLYKAKPWHAAGAALGGIVVGNLGYTEYKKHEAAQTVAGYLG